MAGALAPGVVSRATPGGAESGCAASLPQASATEAKQQGLRRKVWPCGSYYEGNWHEGEMHGEGTFVKADGNTYAGSWVNGKRHGLGRQIYANGDRYVGLWRADQKEGYGRYRWQSGDEYSGQWLNGVMHGSGTMILHTGERYDGEYEGGRLHGQGMFSFANGGTYDGFWDRGQKHGVGLYYRFATAAGTQTAGGAEGGNADKAARDGRLGSIEMSTESPSAPLDLAEASGPASLPASDPHVVSGPIDRASELADLPSTSSLRLSKHRRRLSRAARAERSDVEMVVREYDHGTLVRSAPVTRRELLELLTKMIGRNTDATAQRKVPAAPARPRIGEVIEVGHPSYELMLDLQLGVTWSVGRVTLEPRPAELDSTHFAHRLRTRFPRGGSSATPPHLTHDFTWVDYCPMVFRKLRDVFSVDPAEYIFSLCGKEALREQRSPGKSGALFFMSGDDRFICKTMRHNEVKTFIKMLPAYYNHMLSNPDCLLTHFYGLYRVSVRHRGKKNRKMRFLVMGNIFFNEGAHIHRRFDLKGSTHGRRCHNADQEGVNLKDLDLDITLQLEPEWQDKLFRQLQADCAMLQRACVMDYSLLLGVHFIGRRQEEQTQAINTASLPHESVADARERLEQTIERWQLPEQDAADAVSLVGAQLLRLQRTRNVLQVLGSRSLRPSVPFDAEMAFQQSGQGVRLGLGTSAVAVDSTGKREDVVLYFGIIDYLQEYSGFKKAEHALKALRYGGTAVSVVNPRFYAQRFIGFMQRVFRLSEVKASND